ncbi:hypothetical protein SRHO_G00301700 [Serrasalmus rhombeus]
MCLKSPPSYLTSSQSPRRDAKGCRAIETQKRPPSNLSSSSSFLAYPPAAPRPKPRSGISPLFLVFWTLPHAVVPNARPSCFPLQRSFSFPFFRSFSLLLILAVPSAHVSAFSLPPCKRIRHYGLI